MRQGADDGRHRTTEALAREIGVPRNHIHRIVQDLTEAWFVHTLRGYAGRAAADQVGLHRKFLPDMVGDGGQ